MTKNTQRLFTTLDLPSLNRYTVGFDNILNELSRSAGVLNNNTYPPYNIIRYNNENEADRVTRFGIEIAVAGFDESELDVEVVRGELKVTGKHKENELEDAADYLYHGIAARDFERTFKLEENVSVKGAVVKNGILLVTLEHVVPEADLPKKVAITIQK